MIYRMISGKQIVSKIFADLDIKEGPNRIADIMEWISEAIEKIGAVKQLKRVVSGVDGAPYLKVVGYQAGIPTDLFRLNQVAYSRTEGGIFQPMRISTSNFNAWKQDDANGLDSGNEINQIGSETGDLVYSIKPGYINVPMKEGFLKISYDAMPVDEDGYPLVPDNISYAEAVYWYVVKKLKYPEYLSGKMNENRYHDICRSWNFYAKQAYGEAMMPSADEMDSIKNSWLRLVPEIDDSKSFYANTSRRMTINDKYSMHSRGAAIPASAFNKNINKT